MPGFPQEPTPSRLQQLLARLKTGLQMSPEEFGQGTPQPMAPPPPGMQMPPTMTPGGSMGLPPNPFAEADAAAAAGPVGMPPPIPPLQPPQPPQMPSQDPFAIPQGPPSPIDIQLDPSIPQPHPSDWRMPDFGQNAPPAPPETFGPPPPLPPRNPGPGPPITIRGPDRYKNPPPTPNKSRGRLKNLANKSGDNLSQGSY